MMGPKYGVRGVRAPKQCQRPGSERSMREDRSRQSTQAQLFRIRFESGESYEDYLMDATSITKRYFTSLLSMRS